MKIHLHETGKIHCSSFVTWTAIKLGQLTIGSTSRSNTKPILLSTVMTTDRASDLVDQTVPGNRHKRYVSSMCDCMAFACSFQALIIVMLLHLIYLSCFLYHVRYRQPHFSIKFRNQKCGQCEITASDNDWRLLIFD